MIINHQACQLRSIESSHVSKELKIIVNKTEWMNK